VDRLAPSHDRPIVSFRGEHITDYSQKRHSRRRLPALRQERATAAPIGGLPGVPSVCSYSLLAYGYTYS